MARASLGFIMHKSTHTYLQHTDTRRICSSVVLQSILLTNIRERYIKGSNQSLNPIQSN